MQETRKVKALKSQLNKLIEEKEILKLEIQTRVQAQTAKNKSIESLKQEINKLGRNGVIKVSEHAIIRYLERVNGVSVEQIESEILTPEIVKMVEILGGTGKYPLGEHTLVITDYTITTVV